MPCEWVKMADGTVAHVCMAKNHAHRCEDCGEYSRELRLCDYPLGNGKTCDAEICPNCAMTLGYQNTDIGGGMKRLHDTIDLCALHRDKAAVRGGELVLR